MTPSSSFLWHYLDKETNQMDKPMTEIIEEEAIRAKAIAIEKYVSGDLAGAKEFAVNAQKLNPELCGLQRLNTVLDVRMAYEKKVNGEIDYYGIFSVNPTVDLGTISERYIRLSKAILSDKDNSVGSFEEALGILADAFRYLKDLKMKELLEKRRDQARDPMSRLRDGRNKQKGSENTVQSVSLVIKPRVERPELCVSSTSDQHKNVVASASNQHKYDDGSSASEHQNNVVLSAETITLQDSETHNAAKRAKFDKSKNTNHVAMEKPNVVIRERLNHIQIMNVPDSDFYDFDKDRTEASFEENQVWAAYDDSDAMPRYFALVLRVISREPFKLCVSWLMDKDNKDLGPMKWVQCQYYKTSGRFTLGKPEVIDTLNSFSHRVEVTKGLRTSLHIYPKRGNVWALYKNWSPSWGLFTSDEVIYQYEMVEVLQDFDEEEGVIVAPLVKVPGFKTVFRSDPNMIRTYPKKELFRFSHQVPSHLLTGTNAPEGCLELDPAALSPELLKVLH